MFGQQSQKMGYFLFHLVTLKETQIRAYDNYSYACWNGHTLTITHGAPSLQFVPDVINKFYHSTFTQQ